MLICVVSASDLLLSFAVASSASVSHFLASLTAAAAAAAAVVVAVVVVFVTLKNPPTSQET